HLISPNACRSAANIPLPDRRTQARCAYTRVRHPDKSVLVHAWIDGQAPARRATRPVPEQMETPTQRARAAPGGTRTVAAAVGAAEPRGDGRSRTAPAGRVRKGGFGGRSNHRNSPAWPPPCCACSTPAVPPRRELKWNEWHDQSTAPRTSQEGAPNQSAN